MVPNLVRAAALGVAVVAGVVAFQSAGARDIRLPLAPTAMQPGALEMSNRTQDTVWSNDIQLLDSESAQRLAAAEPPPARQDAAVPRATNEPAQRIAPDMPAVPVQASCAHRIRLHVIEVTLIEQLKETRLLKLEVERFYGKIDGVSLERAKQHETSRFTILFPAALDADIRPGDIIDYGLVDYLAIGRE